MSKPKLEFTIDTKRWMRGNDGGELLSTSGQMCCLGFMCKALGYKNKDILQQCAPDELSDQSKLIKGINYHNLIVINDKKKTSLTKRKELITAEFARQEIAVTFKN